MADEEYNKKLESLQQYVPFLNRMIAQLKEPGKTNREQRLAKVVSLHSMITEKKKLKLATLEKCEEVIRQLQEKAKLKIAKPTNVPSASSVASSTSTSGMPKKSVGVPTKAGVKNHWNKVAVSNATTKQFISKQTVFDRLGKRIFYQPKSPASFHDELADLKDKLQKQHPPDEVKSSFKVTIGNVNESPSNISDKLAKAVQIAKGLEDKLQKQRLVSLDDEGKSVEEAEGNVSQCSSDVSDKVARTIHKAQAVNKKLEEKAQLKNTRKSDAKNEERRNKEEERWNNKAEPRPERYRNRSPKYGSDTKSCKTKYQEQISARYRRDDARRYDRSVRDYKYDATKRALPRRNEYKDRIEVKYKPRLTNCEFDETSRKPKISIEKVLSPEVLENVSKSFERRRDSGDNSLLQEVIKNVSKNVKNCEVVLANIPLTKVSEKTRSVANIPLPEVPTNCQSEIDNLSSHSPLSLVFSPISSTGSINDVSDGEPNPHPALPVPFHIRSLPPPPPPPEPEPQLRSISVQIDNIQPIRSLVNNMGNMQLNFESSWCYRTDSPMQQLDYYPHGSTPTPDPYNQRPPPTLSPQSDGFGEYDPQTKSKKQNSRKEFSVLREFNEQSLTSKNEQFTQQSKVESDRKDDDKESKSKLDGKGRNEGDDMEIINKFLKKLLENEQTRAAASVFIENVSNSLDDEELEAVVQAVRVQNKLDSAKEKPEQTNWGRVVNRKLILDGDDEESVSERKNKTFSKPVIDDNDDDSEEQEQKLTEEKKKKPKPHKTELDLLHDDIRLMFISDGVLTATGRRMCCLLKDDTTKTISESFDMKAPENQKQLNLMRSVRVIIPVHENLDKMNVRNRSIDEEEMYLLRRSSKPRKRYVEDSDDEEKEDGYSLRRSNKSRISYTEDTDDERTMMKDRIEEKIREKEMAEERKKSMRSTKSYINYADQDSESIRAKERVENKEEKEAEKEKKKSRRSTKEDNDNERINYADQDSESIRAEERVENKEEKEAEKEKKKSRRSTKEDNDNERINYADQDSESIRARERVENKEEKEAEKEKKKSRRSTREDNDNERIKEKEQDLSEKNIKDHEKKMSTTPQKKSCSKEDSNDERVKEKEQSEKSSKKQEKKSLTSPSRVSHKKRGAAWANGIIPKSKRKKKVETEKAPQTGEVSVGLDKVELEVNVPLALLEPDKNYFCSKTGRSKTACKLCCFNGRGIAHHYRQEHPEYEVLSSRLRPTKAKEAIEESIRLKLDESEDCPLAPQQKYAFKCRFCDTVMNTRPSSFFDHISSHTGEYRHLCMLCSFGSSMRKCLGFHYKNVHGTLRERKVYSVKSNVYGYICLECNFVQIKKKSVEDHVNIYHLGEGNKIMKIHLSSIEITSGEGVKPTVPKPVKKRPNKEDETESEPPVKKKKPNEEDLPDGNKEQEQPPVEKKKPNEEVLPDKNKEQEQPPVKADEQLEALTLLSRLDASDKKKEVDLDPTVKFEEEAPNLNIVKDLDEEEEQKEEEDESLATPNEEVEEEIEIEIVKDATNEKKIKEVDMAVFTCNTDLQEEINQERLEKMMQLNDCIKVKRQALSIVEKLSNRLLQENSLKSDPEDNPTVESDLEVVTPLKERVFQKVNINIEGTIETILKPQNEVRTVLSAGFLDIVKKSDNLEYACRVSSCSFMSKDRDVFIAHLNKDHGKENQNYKLTRCFICQTEIVATPEEGVLIKFFVHVEERHLGIRQIECEKDVVKTVPLIDEPSKAKGDSSTVLSAGFLDIIKELDGFEYVCRVPSCRFTSKDRETFVNHWNDDHMKVSHDYKMIKCRICQSEVGATLEKTLLMNFFTHVEEKHFEASGIEKSNPFSFTISEVKSLDPVEGSQNFTTESVVSLAEDKDKEEGGFAMEASPSLAEDNDATFTIENVVSLAEDPEDPTPSASAKAPPTRARTKSKPSKPWKTTTALRVFLQHPKKLYKCPQFTCYFATNKRDLFDSHLEIHAGVNDELVCCVYCDVKTFITYAGLHIDLYHASCLYSCSQCLYRALRREYVMVHMKIKHKGVTSIIPLAPKSLKASAKKQKSFTVNETCNPYKCGYKGCTEQFLYQNEYMTHLEEGHDDSMVCGCVNNNLTCTYKSGVASDMIDHWRTHNCYNFHCLICQVGCMELSTMLEHYSTTHPNREPIVVDRRNSPEGEHFSYTNRAFARIKYVKRELFDSVSPHQQTAEVIQVEDDENVVATKDKTENQLLSEEMLLAKYGKMCDPAEKELKCPICLEFKTTKISYFVYHLLLELKCHRFKCDVCSYCSITFGTMAIHCQDEHNDTILSNVTECPVDKRVLLWIQLVMKFQAKAITSQFFFESGEEAQSLFRNTQCDYCGRWFRNLEMLQEHELYHWGELAYVCGICSSKLGTLNEMLHHICIAHPQQPCGVDTNGPSVARLISTWKSFPSNSHSIKEESVTGFQPIQRIRPAKAAEPQIGASLEEEVLVLPSSAVGAAEEVLYACLHCPETVKSVEMLQKHNVESHGGKIDDFHCKVLTKSKVEVMLLLYVLP